MKIVAALIALAIRLPIYGLKLLARNKVVLIIVVVVVGYLLIKANPGGGDAPGQPPEVPAYQLIAPMPKIAPTVIQTQSRVYYVAKAEDDGATITLLVWYDYDAEEWTRHSTPLPLDKGSIKIYKRGAN